MAVDLEGPATALTVSVQTVPARTALRSKHEGLGLIWRPLDKKMEQFFKISLLNCSNKKTKTLEMLFIKQMCNIII